MSGVFGCIDLGQKNNDVAKLTYYGVFSLQHRGQESAGIAVNNNGTFLVHKQFGLVADAFDDVVLSTLQGNMAVGAAKVAKAKEKGSDSLLPTVIKSRAGQVALSLCSTILNEQQIRDNLTEMGAIF